ncbi:RNA polymerase sigma-70 factor, sigma-E family [Asanoa hainanensis]|uniref:RNA polymerase sigma-70 factor, sigma-E family n=1 Tax=Asanoa hainanensis TaxID=560556 RepID=A0A239NH21_9ACTN|nr:SigE family RNA polymerase sigma factor [Asanoa hainanensis]SNT53419.1 RNA polymerase sigma-70 factor, sigma-E family [Asanoa hainanensis]
MSIISRQEAPVSTDPPSVEAEFTAFVSANYGRLLHVADLLIGDAGRAEELLQTVLTRTYLRWSRVRQDNPLGYVRTGLANARTDWLRRGLGRERPTAAVPVSVLAPDPSEQVVGRDAVQRALAVLTRRERAVVVLRFYEDLSEAEIARTLDIAPGTVKSTCARALVKLRVSPELQEGNRS